MNNSYRVFHHRLSNLLGQTENKARVLPRHYQGPDVNVVSPQLLMFCFTVHICGYILGVIADGMLIENPFACIWNVRSACILFCFHWFFFSISCKCSQFVATRKKVQNKSNNVNFTKRATQFLLLQGKKKVVRLHLLVFSLQSCFRPKVGMQLQNIRQTPGSYAHGKHRGKAESALEKRQWITKTIYSMFFCFQFFFSPKGLYHKNLPEIRFDRESW